MLRRRLLYLGCGTVVSWLSACGGDCEVVYHDGSSSQVDTTKIARTGKDCLVHVYSAAQKDSVGPKP